MTSYHSFARFYDAVQGDRAEQAAFVRLLIEEHRPSARTVLELACGTGSILEQLQDAYVVTGLDRSPEMLQVAREKVPKVPLIEGDMTAFDLAERFDAVLCVYDSINHLLDFAQWEALFDRAHEHLEEGGILVFDINTERRLDALCESPAAVQWFGEGHLFVADVRPRDTDGVVAFDLSVFEHESADRYRLHAESIEEASFPRERIEGSLRRRFRRVTTRDRQRRRPSPASERLYFVATGFVANISALVYLVIPGIACLLFG